MLMCYNFPFYLEVKGQHDSVHFLSRDLNRTKHHREKLWPPHLALVRGLTDVLVAE